MSLHSSTEPSLYLLVKNIFVNHIGRSLLNSLTAYTDLGLLLKLTWGTYTQYCRLSTGLYGPGVTDHIRDSGPMATVVEI